MQRALIIVAAGLALAACGHASEPEVIVPLPDPCPASGTAELEPRPPQVAITDDEDLALGVQGIRILGPDRYAGRELSRAQAEARTARLETRIEQTRRWCASRRPDPG